MAKLRKGEEGRETVKVDVELLNELEVLAKSFHRPRNWSLQSWLNSMAVRMNLAIQKLSNTIASVTAKMRMVEVRPVFQKIGRMVRDLSKKTEKLVKLVIQGEDTMLDRVMAEKISAPLVHMVRNAVDHGLEDADGRKRPESLLSEQFVSARIVSTRKSWSKLVTTVRASMRLS